MKTILQLLQVTKTLPPPFDDHIHFPQKLGEKYPNLYADLSATSGYTALTRDPEFGRQYLIDHSDKLLFARAIYDNKLMDHLKTLDLPSDASDKIMYVNAEKLVGAAHA